MFLYRYKIIIQFQCQFHLLFQKTDQKKRKNLSKNLTKIRNIPYEDWIITENTHEAIISREIFFEVQRICMQELEKNPNNAGINLTAKR